MTTYGAIVNSEVDADSPYTASLAFRMANNPLAIAEGDATAPKIAIDVSGQTAIETDETDTTLVLKPDGAGGVLWGGSPTITNTLTIDDDLDGSFRYGIAGLSTTATYIIHGIASSDGKNSQVGLAVLVANSLTHQKTVYENSYSNSAFVWSGGVLYWYPDTTATFHGGFIVAHKVA